MQIIVHRGTHQIGGCVTEIKSEKGTRIAIDIGENLPSSDDEINLDLSIEGLTYGTPNFNAIFITHYHGDHVGLYNKVLPQIPIYMGEVSKNIYKILQTRLAKKHIISYEDLSRIDAFKTFKIPEKIKIDDITITPIEVDHSAFNAQMLFIECDGKKVLHTGDFRTHGQRGKAVISALEKYVGQVDCLICEGTTLSRDRKPPMKEFELQQKAEQIFKENKYVFVMCSSTNIDRIAAIHKATLNSHRLFVCDDYQKELLLYIDSISRSSLYKFKNRVLSYDDNILPLMQEYGFVMLVRDNYTSKQVMEFFPRSTFVYSQWDGYLDKKFKQYEHLQQFVPKQHIRLHTSGHADFEAIKSVCECVKPKILVPIHSENPSGFQDMNLENCEIKLPKDGEKINLL